MKPVDYALLAKRSYADAPTVGRVDSASRMHVYGDVHVFRGSDDLASWAHDFDIAVVDVPGLGKIHAGFWAAWLAIRDECMALPAPKAIVGHSLGGALAIICAADWALQGVTIPVFAFEPPRLCCDNTMQALLLAKQVPFYATRNGHDLVTQVPPEMTLPGPMTQIGKGVLPFDNVEDHSIDRVIGALAA
jgi:triacylglycerol lipase